MARRPKRPAGAISQHAHELAASSHSGQPSSKKQRFDAYNPSTLAAADDDDGDDDDILDLDEIGKSTRAKRSGVQVEGYDSDSDPDNFDARAEAKAKATAQQARAAKARAKDDEDADMFAGSDEEEEADGDGIEGMVKGKEKKEVRFMKTSEIQGQEVGAQSDDSDSGEDVGDEERDRVGSDVDEELGAGAKKQHAPKIDAFNMRAEGEEGRFDESGNFVRNAVDPLAQHDNWLQDVSKKDMKKARLAHEKREEEQRTRRMERDAIATSDVLATLIEHLEPAETALEALQRLNKGRKPKKKPAWQKNKRKPANGDAMEVDEDTTQTAAEEAAEKRLVAEVEAITEAADHLMAQGQDQIYVEDRELLMRQYYNETGEHWVDKDKPDAGEAEANGNSTGTGMKQWEYRWSDARDGGELHGPYDGPTMCAWDEAGYFGGGVEFREAGGGGDFSSSVAFV